MNGSLIISNESAIQVESFEMKPLNSPISIVQSEILTFEPADCCPQVIMKHFRCCSPFVPEIVVKYWKILRTRAHRMVEHRAFEWLIIASILASSTTLVR